MKIDFHVHTNYSRCSAINPKAIVKSAIKKGLSGIAVTDHNTMKALDIVKQFSKSKNILVIAGEEIKTDCGDVIGLFLDGEIKSRELFSVLDEIKKCGGIAVAPHPFDSIRKEVLRADESMFKKFDAIEILNGRCSRSANYKAAALASRLKKPVIAGSDAHFASEIGRCFVEFSDSVNTTEAVRKALLRGNCSIGGSTSALRPLYMAASKILKIKRKCF